jgi:hypothetical protein
VSKSRNYNPHIHWRDNLKARNDYNFVFRAFWLEVNKAKAVPLHATKALGEREGIAPTYSRPRH